MTGRLRPLPAVVLLAVAACSGGAGGGGGLAGDDRSRTTEQSSTGPSSPLPAGSNLQVGQCFEAPTPAPGAPLDATAIQPADCLQPHTYEAYARLDHPGGPDQPYPGDDLMVGFGTDQCLTEFPGYVGVAYEASTLDLVPVELGKAAWEAGGRTIVCALHAADLEPLTGSMRDAAI